MRRRGRNSAADPYNFQRIQIQDLKKVCQGSGSRLSFDVYPDPFRKIKEPYQRDVKFFLKSANVPCFTMNTILYVSLHRRPVFSINDHLN